jgi:hypothetical protein
VSSGGARRGRRDNGLTAAEYAVVADVDPRIGEHLLDVLGLAGIAAYLQPAADLHPVTRTTTLPATPADRLYVDRGHVEVARRHLDQLLPRDTGPDGPGQTGGTGAGPERAGAAGPERAAAPPGRRWTDPADEEIDAAWASIIAGYTREAPEPSGPEASAGTPPSPDTTSTDRPARTGGVAGGPGGTDPANPRPRPPVAGWRGATDPPSLLDGLDTFGADLPDEDDEGYVPPPPPPMPRPSAPTVLAVLGVVAGLVLVIWPDLLPADPTTTLVVGGSALVAGFVTLVWRLRPGDDEDDRYDPDDGAVV